MINYIYAYGKILLLTSVINILVFEDDFLHIQINFNCKVISKFHKNEKSF